MMAYYVSIVNNVSEYGYDIGVTDQVQILLEYVLLFETYHPFSIFGGGSSYLAQRLLIVSRLQQRFPLTNMTLNERLSSHKLKTCLWLELQTPLVIFLTAGLAIWHNICI